MIYYEAFSMQELLARVKMHLRREERIKGNVQSNKDWEAYTIYG